MPDAMSVPLWVIALVLAAFAPFAARVLASTLEQRARDRSRRILAPLAAADGGRQPEGSVDDD
jgi:hypothetical protein